MKTKLNKWKETKLTINYLGNFNNDFGLAQKHTTFIDDINQLSLGVSPKKTNGFSSKIKENNIKTKREFFNFHPILINDWESTNNYYFMNYINNYSNLQRVNTSKRLVSYKRPKSSRFVYLRNDKENIKNDFNDKNMNHTTSINTNNTNINNLKYKPNYVDNFTTMDNLPGTSCKNSLKYFIDIKSSHSKKRKFAKKFGNHYSEYDSCEKDNNFKVGNQTKYSKFIIDHFYNYKQKEKSNDINEFEGRKRNNFIFNNKLLRSKVNYFSPSKNKEFINLKELINEKGNFANKDCKRKIKLKNFNSNKKLFNENLSIISGKTSNCCEASTNTELANLK